ncbi:serine/threonine-protein kinase tousled-like 2 [Lytechinus variegatus]|uniref:serine/threonine-protein kinase tousled-like 2 n=1 Tax=Lytechinus variegatus TaxID=7654 RepID=UPI001BB11CA5|nr:serine/threonine-protein kinase tousled-like 2 [Lytechinus variegatus]XP_041478197.1 serine/threonine-protein kinase tousled-like 2 [Lytechinus variegatus]XP_041478198.1 serine/threonine-protein kinase tousled-like 2 [Lytechinus variegatus]
MQEFRHFDPQKLELLEARIKGNRSSQQPIMIADDSNHSTSTCSRGSPSDDIEVMQSETPEKERKKRKRKGQDSDQSGPKKISEYFKAATSLSPGRTGLGIGILPKSPPSSSYPSQMMSSPCGNSNDYISHSSQSPKPARPRFSESSSISTQTEMSLQDLELKERQHQSHMRVKEETIETLNSTTQDLQRRLDSAQKLLEKVKEQSKKSTEKIKQLLIEKARTENKEARTKSMEDRLRLGQFTTQRQGAKFVETWNDGYAFTDLVKRQEKIAKEREELDQQRKSLMKRKPPNSPHPSSKSRPKQNGPNDEGFAKPFPEFMNHAEFYERDEILKLRQAAFKKEEADLQGELEKLERERNLHIRELKRIHNEDQSTFRDHKVLNDRYLLLRLLGKGGFSEVYKGYDLKEHRDVACKIHQLSKEWKEDKKANYIKHALREYEIHKSLDHARVVKLYDVFEIDANSFCTVLEFCPGNDLDFHLKQHKLMVEREARCIIMQVVSALKYLNERKPPIIHYDLKPGNILLCHGSTCGAIKLTDFGLSKVMDDEHFNSQEGGMDLTSQGAGTYWYLPPECFVVGKEPPKISSKVDVWSTGIIFYQCLYGKKPFGHNLSQASILEQNTILRATQVQFSPKPTVSQEAKDFIRRCLMYRKEDRADVLALAKDPYLMPSNKKSSAAAAAHASAAAVSSPQNQLSNSENST